MKNPFKRKKPPPYDAYIREEKTISAAEKRTRKHFEPLLRDLRGMMASYSDEEQQKWVRFVFTELLQGAFGVNLFEELCTQEFKHPMSGWQRRRLIEEEKKTDRDRIRQLEEAARVLAVEYEKTLRRTDSAETALASLQIAYTERVEELDKARGDHLAVLQEYRKLAEAVSHPAIKKLVETHREEEALRVTKVVE